MNTRCVGWLMITSYYDSHTGSNRFYWAWRSEALVQENSMVCQNKNKKKKRYLAWFIAYSHVGFGGKVEKGETIEQGVRRELLVCRMNYTEIICLPVCAGRSRDRGHRFKASWHAHVYVWKGPCWLGNACICYNLLQGHAQRVSVHNLTAPGSLYW